MADIRLRLLSLIKFTTSTIIVLSMLNLNVVTGDACLKSVCEYNFVIRKGYTMTYRTEERQFQVKLNGSRLVVVENMALLKSTYPDVIGKDVTDELESVVTGDGYERDVYLINEKFPGPTIEVLEGTQVVVHVHNRLVSEVTSLHWHGMYQRKNFYMDGVPYLTQCPILPQQSFEYRFRAEPAGTHWYHSHQAGQRIDGLYGMLIVHPVRLSPVLPSYCVFVTDWYHYNHETMQLRNKYLGGTGQHMQDIMFRHRSTDGVELSVNIYVSSLINGRGRWKEGKKLPLQRFVLFQGGVQRFRFVNAGAEYSYEVSVDGHVMEVVAVDGHDIRPIRVDSFIVHPGETVDVDVAADWRRGRYWMRARTLRNSTTRTSSTINANQYDDIDLDANEAKAILVYSSNTNSSSVDDETDPNTERRQCTNESICIVFNCPFLDYPEGYNRTCITARSTLDRTSLEKTYGISNNDNDDVTVEAFLNIAFLVGASVNGRKFLHPREFQHPLDPYLSSCNAEHCDNAGCQCTYRLSVPQNVTLQLVLYNRGPLDQITDTAYHTIHIHGHSFSVLETGFAYQNDSGGGILTGPNPNIVCENDFCTRGRWADGAVRNGNSPLIIRDTVLVPAWGYAVIRFRTDNPGRWMIHCHQSLHLMEGMAMIMDEALDLISQPPTGFSTCRDFKWTEDEHRKTYNTSLQEEPSAGVITISTMSAFGIAVAFVLLGVFLTALPSVIFAFHFSKKNLESVKFQKSTKIDPLR